MSFPDARTRLLGVIGHPVDHSLSPAMHNAALRHAGVNAVYLAFDAPPEGFETAVEALRRLGAAGVNVTIPHKIAALAIANRSSDDAMRVGAANTLVFGEGGIVGHNTDVAGVDRALAAAGLAPRGLRCLLLGAGGAARGAAGALVQGGAAQIVIANRTADRADELARELVAETVAWEDAAAAASGCDVVVNATSVGLQGDDTPLSPWALEQAAGARLRGVLDLVYRTEETRLVRFARQAGIRAADGLDVLVYQGAAAFELFVGTTAPVDIMRQAAFRAAGRPLRRTGADAEDVPPLV